MTDKQELLTEYLKEQLCNIKVGIIIKGVEDINPEDVIKGLYNSDDLPYLHVAVVGYEDVSDSQNEEYCLKTNIESAVLWRSMPEYAGSIIVFVKSDSDKLHSLAEFDEISTRDISKFLLDTQIHKDNNAPICNFWEALKEDSDYYTFDSLNDFVSSVEQSNEPAEGIPQNMWRLNLLNDFDILATKNDPSDRLSKNRDLITTMGQLSEEARKKLSRSLAKTNENDKEKLQSAYRCLQNYYKYGNKETLRTLDYNTVQELFSASKKNDNKPKTPKKRPKKEDPGEPNVSTPINSKELEKLASEAIVFGDENELKDVGELVDALNEHYNSDEDEDIDPIPTLGGRFNDRPIPLETKQSDLRKLVGTFCNQTVWGGIMETDETVLKDAISADRTGECLFEPENKDSIIISYNGGIDGTQSLFDFIVRFDKQFDEQGIDNAERFAPIIEDIKSSRKELLNYIDMIMYHPILLFGGSQECRNILIKYIQSWEQLYHAMNVNGPKMAELSPKGTTFTARALLLLDVLYIKTPTEWKGILLPLNPIYLWRYYEIFRSYPGDRGMMDDSEKDALSEVLSKLPQVLNFIVASSLVTGSPEERILPCSGNIEMLPTFENKTNRYLGNDGTESVKEVLTRWVGFAPYTRNEVRICSVDAPDLVGILKQIESFMDKDLCQKVVYDVYLTRNQNGNTELSKIDYSGDDYELGEYIKSGRISISIKNVHSSQEVKQALQTRPVHVAFYFDQSSYEIDYGPQDHNLYINPLVVTYDYDFDTIEHKGTIYPSTDTDSGGLIGDYHKLIKTANVISDNMNPRTTYVSNADMTAVVSTIEDNQAQWLVVADRDTDNYQPSKAIPIGEMQYDKRVVNVWTSDKSRIISQYMDLLRKYNLNPKEETLVELLRKFGHIAGNGLISIPKFGADSQAIENKRKGLLGTLFASSWYMKQYSDDALVASLDDEKARIWLHDSKYGNERADLIGLHYDNDSNILYIQPIEVKTRDDSYDAQITKDDLDSHKHKITGHAAEQITSIVEMIRDIFANDEDAMDMFTSARREVLKYQIVSECFRSVHDAAWQNKWYGIFKKAFDVGQNKDININVSGLLLHFKLNEASGGEHIKCESSDADDCVIDYWRLTTKEIQNQIFDDESPVTNSTSIDFDISKEETDDIVKTDAEEELEDAIVDTDIDIKEVDIIEDKKDESDQQNQSNQSNDVSHDSEGEVINREENFEGGDKSIQNNGSHDEVTLQDKEQLIRDFKRACNDYHVELRECNASDIIIGPGIIRLKFKLAYGQSLQGLTSHLEDIGREMKKTGVIVQQVPNSDELLLDIPREKREKVLFKDVVSKLPKVTSPEQLYFPLGKTPDGVDLIEDLGLMPHMLVGGSTGSGKTILLLTMLASFLLGHPYKQDLQLILSSSKFEDFTCFEGLPQLYSGHIISDAKEATRIIKEVISAESNKRGQMLAQKRVQNIIDYNKIADEKMAPIVVVIDEFADLAEQLETKKEQDAFYNIAHQIAATGRNRGIHLVVCTQRPEAKLVPSAIKSQLNGRVALRVNDGISSRMIIDSPDAQYLQKHGDMIYKNADVVQRAQGYFIEMSELYEIVDRIKEMNNN